MDRRNHLFGEKSNQSSVLFWPGKIYVRKLYCMIYVRDAGQRAEQWIFSFFSRYFLGKDAQSKFITLDGEGQNNFLSVYAPVAFYQTRKFCSIFNHEVSEKFQTAFDRIENTPLWNFSEISYFLLASPSLNLHLLITLHYSEKSRSM